MKQLVVILMGSKSDETHGKEIAMHLSKFGIPSKLHVASAHKATAHLIALLKKYDASGDSIVYVAIAGRSNALGGVVDGNSLNPVINCPPISDKFAGLDLLSSLRMPSGLGATTILEAENCAVACAKVFATQDKEVKAKVQAYKKEMEAKASGN